MYIKLWVKDNEAQVINYLNATGMNYPATSSGVSN